MKLYKLTDENMNTRGGTLWGEGVTHEAPGTGPLCSAGWLHAYESSAIATFMNPAHAGFSNPVLWESEGAGELLRDGQLKIGVQQLTTLRIIPLPEITTEQRVEIAIRCAMAVIGSGCPKWLVWAERWLVGADRTASAAASARTAAWSASAMAEEAAMARAAMAASAMAAMAEEAARASAAASAMAAEAMAAEAAKASAAASAMAADAMAAEAAKARARARAASATARASASAAASDKFDLVGIIRGVLANSKVEVGDANS